MQVVLAALERHNLVFTAPKHVASKLDLLPTRPFLGAGGSGIVYRVHRAEFPDCLFALKVVVGRAHVLELKQHFELWTEQYELFSHMHFCLYCLSLQVVHSANLTLSLLISLPDVDISRKSKLTKLT
jgi:hypothetical protein